MRFVLHCLIVLLLTVITQIGGIIWLLSIFLARRFEKRKRYIFPMVYLVFNLIIIPPIAKTFGREKLPVFSKVLKPRNWMYPLLFRNYVRPELKTLLTEVSNDQELHIVYLDANFPFFNKFPLLPHLSHNDGKKIDLSFYYLDESGEPTNKKPSISGYGVFTSNDNETSDICKEKGYWQYDYPKYLTFGTINTLYLDKIKTKQLLEALTVKPKIEKIFIEPYLKTSLGLNDESKIRFHGCKAVRHDDHIHLQIK